MATTTDSNGALYARLQAVYAAYRTAAWDDLGPLEEACAAIRTELGRAGLERARHHAAEAHEHRA